jgi:teichoic acid transport system ATP-binding protein
MSCSAEDRKTVVKFDHVTKIYKLFKNDKRRLASVFSKKVKYDIKRAVDDMCFEIKQGEAVALVGRNGAGKSTILKLITGVSFPTEGAITVEGRVSALLELGAGFDEEMTGKENITLKGQLMGLTDEDIERLTPAIVDFAELGPYIDQPIRTYSSGMRAKLGFAVNVSIEPEIFIVDEALSVGDQVFREKCLAKVREIIARDSVTLIFVTHSIADAASFCERGIVIREGESVFDGRINEAVEYYNEHMAD